MIPCFSLVSLFLLKQSILLCAEIMPWTVAWIKISFISLYLSHALSLLPPPSFSPKSSCPKFTCDDPGGHISARRAVQVFTQHFPSFSIPLSNIHAVVQKKFHCSYKVNPNRPYYPNTSHCQPLMVNSWPQICTTVYLPPILYSKIKIFSTTITWGL